MTGRVFWIAVNSVFEMVRDRTVTGFLAVGAVLIMGGFVIADMSVVERTRMYIDTGVGAIFIVGVFIALLAGSNVLDREVRDRQVFCTLAKPVPRSAWVVGKMAGFLATLFIVILILTVFMFLFVRFGARVWAPNLFIAALLIFLQMSILSGYVVLFTTITSQYLSLFFGMLVLLIGHGVSDLKIYWAGASTAVRVVTRALYYVIPDFEAFLPAPVINSAAGDIGGLIAFIILYAAMYLVVTTTISVIIMNRKELA